MKASAGIGILLLALTPAYLSAQSKDDANTILRSSPLLSPAPPPQVQPSPSAPAKETVAPPNAAAPESTKKDNAPATVRLSNNDIIRHGSNSTVLVLRLRGKNVEGYGSGFRISRSYVLTNSHVVEGRDQVEIVAHNGQRVTAKVIAVGLQNTGRDFAALELTKSLDGEAVTFTTQYAPLTVVHAFGFPWIALRDTPSWKAIFSGDVKAMPGIVVSTGSIQYIGGNAKNIQVLMHSAKITGGNSGGPLFDACGRVVGINSYSSLNIAPVVSADGKPFVTSDGKHDTPAVARVDSGYAFSLSGAEILKWVESRGLKVAINESKCD